MQAHHPSLQSTLCSKLSHNLNVKVTTVRGTSDSGLGLGNDSKYFIYISNHLDIHNNNELYECM